MNAASSKTKKAFHKVKSDDYIYASSRARAREAKYMGSDGILRLSEAKNLSEVFRMLSDGGFEISYLNDGSVDVEATLNSYLLSAYDLVKESVPQPELFDFLRYTYDCHNIKSAIKCEFRNEDFSQLYIGMGTLSREAIENMMRERDFHSLPTNMSLAAIRAIDTYSQTGDPQQIDILLDSACYEDMTAIAESFRKPFFVELVRRKIDITNILTCIRMLRMDGVSIDFFRLSFLKNGYLKESVFENAFSNGEEVFSRSIANSDYRVLSEFQNLGFAQLEKLADNCYLGFVKKSKNVIYGAEVLCAFLTAREYEVKNIRIIIAAKQAQLDNAQIKERLRDVF